MVFGKDKKPGSAPETPEKAPEDVVEDPKGPDTPETPESAPEDALEGSEEGSDEVETPDDPAPEPELEVADSEPEDEPEDEPEPVREIPAAAVLKKFAGKSSQAKYADDIDAAFADLLGADPSRDEFVDAMQGIDITPGMLWSALKAHR